MDKNPLLGRLMKDRIEDVAHTSVYAQAQNADRMGAASSQSFAARREIDQNRQNVKVYKDSEVATGVGKGLAKATSFEAQKEASQIAAIKEKFGDRREHQFGGGADGSNGGSQKGVSADKQAQVTPPARRNPGISW